jgi:hypothetical protein
VFGAWNLPSWDNLPNIGTFSLLENFGLSGGLASNLALLAAVVGFSIWIERRRRLRRPAGTSKNDRASRWLTGPWPLAAGALALALVNVATLALAGRPWGVTSAFALWGSKLLGATGLDVAAWPYWSSPGRAAALAGPVFNDVTSIMNIGVILGALLAAGLAGRFAPVWRVPLHSLTAALLGGILLGYGARLAYGCNIGAFFSGVASSSLHGWLWFIAAFIGNMAGTRLRPLFRLA